MQKELADFEAKTTSLTKEQLIESYESRIATLKEDIENEIDNKKTTIESTGNGYMVGINKRTRDDLDREMFFFTEDEMRDLLTEVLSNIDELSYTIVSTAQDIAEGVEQTLSKFIDMAR